MCRTRAVTADASVINDPAQYELLTDFTVVSNHPGLPTGVLMHRWYYPSPGYFDTPQVNYFTEWHGVSVHPGQPGHTPEYIVVGWRSPITGSVGLQGFVRSGALDCQAACDGVDWRISKNSMLLADGVIPDGGEDGFASIAIDVVEGDLLFVAVGPQADFGWDSTRLEVTIFGR